MWGFFTQFISPKKFVRLSSQWLPWLSAAFFVLFTYGLIGGLLLAPADYMQGDAFRIIYVHVPCAFLSLFIYLVIAGAALCGLVFRIKLAFLVMRHSLSLGAGFTFLALFTGSLWGKPMWGTWWIWDARLTSELILLFIYSGLLLFQSATAEKRQGERATAILALVGLIDIPIIHYSVYWWTTLHQGATLNFLVPQASAIDSSMRYPLFAMIAAFLLYYAIVLFLHLRYDLIVSAEHPDWIRAREQRC
jgi:heme exporter protein C